MTRNGIQVNGEGSLVRALGVWGLAANIVNITVGGGIFRLPAAAASLLGPAAPLAYIVCAAVMGLVVICFAEAGSRVAGSGGIYAYVEVALGPLVGFLSGVLLWAGITAAAAAVATFFADSLGALVPALASGGPRSAIIVVALVGLAVLNIAGVRSANRFNVVMTVAKLIPLALLVLVGVVGMHRENLTWTTTPAASSVTRASAVLIFAFLGVEAALTPSGEVRDSSRTVPRAIFIAMVGITILYIAVQLVTQGILGAQLAGQKTPVAEAAAVVLGSGGRTLILVGMTISMFGYASGMTLSIPRMLFAFARDGFLPAQVAAVHPRFKTPYVAIAIQTLIVIGLALSGSFEKLAVIANGSALLSYFMCCGAVIQLRRRGIQQAGEPFRLPMAGAVPIAAMVAIAWLLSGLTMDEWKAVLIVVAVAAVVFAASLPSRRAAAAIREHA